MCRAFAGVQIPSVSPSDTSQQPLAVRARATEATVARETSLSDGQPRTQDA